MGAARPAGVKKRRRSLGAAPASSWSFERMLEKTAGSLRGVVLMFLLRKEVIQPLVPQRLPCYDFIPITTHTLGRRMPDFGCRRLS